VGNVDVVLEVYRRSASGESARDLLHEDVDWLMPHPGGAVQGRSELGVWWRDYEATWENRVIEVEDARELEDGRVLVFFTERARGRASGIDTSASPAAIWTLRDGKVARFQAWIDRAEALEEAGLAPPPGA
jgi:ketosteroid isomerase-like protein